MIKSWIHAARLRTLPLALSGIILGSAFAYAHNSFSWLVFTLAIITTLLLQVLSNFANDYGDHMHGTDNEERIGPTRALQSGAITPRQMKIGIIITGTLALFTGIALLLIALNGLFSLNFGIFFLLGLLAIAAAIKYTVGKSNYGYKGFGDIMVFVFFGLTAVIGTYFLNTQAFNFLIFVPAVAIGFLSTGVLNLNNMRDVENDRASGKITLAVKLGSEKSKKYHSVLIIAPIVGSLVFAFLMQNMLLFFLLIIPSAILVRHLQNVFYNTTPETLDPELKRLSLTTLLFAILFSAGMVLN